MKDGRKSIVLPENINQVFASPPPRDPGAVAALKPDELKQQSYQRRLFQPAEKSDTVHF